MKKIDLKNKKRIVVKIGSALLVEKESFRKSWFKSLIKDISELSNQGFEIIIVSSGAIAFGNNFIKHKKNNATLPEKQAAAAVGQNYLISLYQDYFKKFKIDVAQILMTADDCDLRKRYLNLNNTIKVLLDNKIIPIVNENDSVGVDEIKIGDNDRLAARVAQISGANILVLLSDIDGLYDKNPNLNTDAKFISEVTTITRDIEKYAGNAVSKVGSGGMKTKIMAAKMLKDSSCETIITSGKEKNPLKKLFLGKKNFTCFYSSKNKPLKARKKWLAGFLNIKAGVVINECAKQALTTKKVSLLPVGVVKVKGNFKKGETIFIEDEEGNNIASGISNYSSEDANKIITKKSNQVKEIIGLGAKKELVHIDNLVVSH